MESAFLNQLTVEPLTRKNWGKFEALFGSKGACGNCWCMYYRLSKTDFREGKAEDGNKQAMKELVWGGNPAGMLGPTKDKPLPGVPLHHAKTSQSLKSRGYTNALTKRKSGRFPVSLSTKISGGTEYR